jgi:hypothetical protein
VDQILDQKPCTEAERLFLIVNVDDEGGTHAAVFQRHQRHQRHAVAGI